MAQVQEVRCPNCSKKLAEGLEGTLVAFCRGCKRIVVVQHHKSIADLTGELRPVNT